MGNKPIDLLLVEDNPGDVRLTREALKLCKHKINLHVTEDGEKAIDFLYKQGSYTNVPFPDLIFLDLNLPKKHGLDVLAEIKSDHALQSIPVFILTTSNAEEDIIKSYSLYANCYLQKPVDVNKFKEMIQTIDEFWFSFVKQDIK